MFREEYKRGYLRRLFKLPLIACFAEKGVDYYSSALVIGGAKVVMAFPFLVVAVVGFGVVVEVFGPVSFVGRHGGVVLMG